MVEWYAFSWVTMQVEKGTYCFSVCQPMMTGKGGRGEGAATFD